MNDFIDILAGLTGPQRDAVLHLGSPLLIIAGPGSGKTEVIARRVAYLVQSGAVQPDDERVLRSEGLGREWSPDQGEARSTRPFRHCRWAGEERSPLNSRLT